MRLTDSQRVTGTAYKIIEMFDTNFFKIVKQIFFWNLVKKLPVFIKKKNIFLANYAKKSDKPFWIG